MDVIDQNDGDAGWRGKMSQTTKSAGDAADKGDIPGRRLLRFNSIDDVMAEVERLAEAERGGRLRRLGNWTLGQALNHLACWAEYCYTGTPLKVPFFVKWLLRLRKRKFLSEPMPSSVRIPGVAGGTPATEPKSLGDGLERIRRVVERLSAESPTKPHSIFGPLSYEEWIASRLRHAELHLGFFIAE
jgi:Protein of unknown function (DUF1569)